MQKRHIFIRKASINLVQIWLNVNIGYMQYVLIELWRPITFEPITYLIVSIHHMIHLIDLSKNNHVARLANNRLKSYGPPTQYLG